MCVCVVPSAHRFASPPSKRWSRHDGGGTCSRWTVSGTVSLESRKRVASPRSALVSQQNTPPPNSPHQRHTISLHCDFSPPGCTSATQYTPALLHPVGTLCSGLRANRSVCHAPPPHQRRSPWLPFPSLSTCLRRRAMITRPLRFCPAMRRARRGGCPGARVDSTRLLPRAVLASLLWWADLLSLATRFPTTWPRWRSG